MGCLASVMFLAAGCLDNTENVVPTEVAYVSLYQASPNAPELGIIVDDRQINNYPFDYSEYTGYLQFFTGSRNLRFGPFGANNVVVDTTLNLENGKAYSIFVVDDYTKADVLVLEDNEVAVEGKAMVRFLNLSPDADKIDLIAEGEASPVFDDQAFKATSTFKAIDAKEYDFTVTSPAGTQLLQIPDTPLAAGRFYTILVRGYGTPPSGNGNVLSSEILIQ